MITEKTMEEKSTHKNYSNDNYSYIAPASLITYPIKQPHADIAGPMFDNSIIMTFFIGAT